MQLNPLWTDTMVADAIRTNGFQGGMHMIQTRRQGKSTAIAFSAIANAMHDPRNPVVIRDHFGSDEARKMLLETVYGIIRRTGLVKFYKHGNMISFGIPNGPTYNFNWQEIK